jgi:hypothetical protein
MNLYMALRHDDYNAIRRMPAVFGDKSRLSRRSAINAAQLPP